MQKMWIKINGKEHCKEVQLALFKLGYGWSWGGKELKDFNSVELHLNYFNENEITQTSNMPWGAANGGEEYKIVNGKLVPADSQKTEHQPLGLRPRYIVDSLRIREVVDAIQRYVYADKQVPQAWLDELTLLNANVEA